MPWHFLETLKARDRRHLLEVNQENVNSAYTQAKNSNLDDPVIFLLDLRYEKAAILAEASIGQKGKIGKMIDDCAGKKVIPTIVAALPHGDAVEALSSILRNAHDVLSSTIPRGYFRVMVVAFGGHIHSACREPKSPAADIY